MKRKKLSGRYLVFALTLILISLCNQSIYSQPKIDYSVKSNILNPDTLKDDQKLIFWHFVELTHKQAKELEPLQVKAEFDKLGISSDRKRFGKAAKFFLTTMKNHKKSCEQWESFKDLAPKFKE